jgi:predicted AAA+ superfamily ATPase
LADNRPAYGKLITSSWQIIDHITWSRIRANLFHFRTANGQEVDIVLESDDGRIVGIECKGSATVKADSFKGLKVLQEMTGKKFHRGIVLYAGSHIIGVAEDMQAVPVSALWEL